MINPFNSHLNSLSQEEVLSPETDQEELLQEVAERPEDENQLIPVDNRVKTAWGNFCIDWWKIHEGEDAEDYAEKSKKKFEPLGVKQYVALGLACIYVVALSIIFRHEPIVAAGLTGSIMGFIKISYSQMSDMVIPKWTMRTIALTTLIASLVFHFLPNPGNVNEVLFTMSALPLADAGMAVFAKCELNRLKPEKHAVALIHRCCHVEVSKKKAKVVSTIVQGVAAAALMNPTVFGNYIAAAGAVLSKAKMRRLVDMVWQQIDKMDEGCKKKGALAAAYGSLAILTGTSTFALSLPVFSHPMLSLIPLGVGIVSADTLIRTAKQAVKAYEVPKEFRVKQPPTCCSRLGTLAKGLAIVGGTFGIGAFVGPRLVNAPVVTSVASNPGLVVTVCQEAGSWIKVATKKLVSQKIALITTVGTVAIGSGVYLAKDLLAIDRQTWIYGNLLFLGITSVNTSLYLMKRHLQGKRRKESVEEQEGNSVEMIPVDEIEEVQESQINIEDEVQEDGIKEVIPH
jgi:hypothetical protein